MEESIDSRWLARIARRPWMISFCFLHLKRKIHSWEANGWWFRAALVLIGRIIGSRQLITQAIPGGCHNIYQHMYWRRNRLEKGNIFGKNGEGESGSKKRHWYIRNEEIVSFHNLRPILRISKFIEYTALRYTILRLPDAFYNLVTL